MNCQQVSMLFFFDCNCFANFVSFVLYIQVHHQFLFIRINFSFSTLMLLKNAEFFLLCWIDCIVFISIQFRFCFHSTSTFCWWCDLSKKKSLREKFLCVSYSLHWWCCCYFCCVVAFLATLKCYHFLSLSKILCKYTYFVIFFFSHFILWCY